MENNQENTENSPSSSSDDSELEIDEEDNANHRPKRDLAWYKIKQPFENSLHLIKIKGAVLKMMI